MFPLHPSPTEISKGRLTPSSRRHCRHHRYLLCRRLRLPLRLPRLALVEEGHWQQPTDQNGLIRGMLNVFCSCPMVRLKFFSQPEQRARRTAGGGAVLRRPAVQSTVSKQNQKENRNGAKSY